MGEDIASAAIDSDQEGEFLRRVKDETTWLKEKLTRGQLEYAPRHGFELEGYLIDSDGRPASCNEEFLERVNEPAFTHEIAQFNWEINGEIFDRSPTLLRDILDDFEKKASRARSVAGSMDLQALFIGVLPTLREDVLTLEHMSPVNRYYALTQRLIRLRQGRAIQIRIGRHDSISLKRSDLMIEAAATSLQVHSQVNLKDSVEFYNLSQVLAAPLVAASANSPFFLGRKLWDETRIPIFEQAVQLGDLPEGRWQDPVTMGSSYCEKSLIELFEKNYRSYPAILPVLFAEPCSRLRHLKLLNGQVWRWNRPIVSVNDRQEVGLRVEFRPLPAGPTLVDMVANMALYWGLLAYYDFGARPCRLVRQMKFSQVCDNFYAAAQMGMKAQVEWGDLGSINIQKLLYEVLFDQAKEGLKSMGLQKGDIEFFMDQVLKPRLLKGFTGAAWQKSFVDLHGADFQKMVLAYAENQWSAEPVHSWKV